MNAPVRKRKFWRLANLAEQGMHHNFCFRPSSVFLGFCILRHRVQFIRLFSAPPSTLSQKHFLGSKCFKILHEHFRDMGGAVLGGGGGTYISRYGRCCFEIWEVLCWGGQGGKSFEIWEVLFRDMGGAVWGVGVQTFRDMGGAVSRYERCCFNI